MSARRRFRPLTASLLCALAALAVSCTRTAPPAPVIAGQPGNVRTVAHGLAAPGMSHPGPHPDSVTVQAGDTLYGVARRYDVPVRSLIDANGLTPPYGLVAGRTLILPQVRQHIVQSGETLYSVSRQFGVDSSTLARINHLDPPYVIRVGTPLILPAQIRIATAAAAPLPMPRDPVARQPLPPKAAAPTAAPVAPSPASSVAPAISPTSSMPPPEPRAATPAVALAPAALPALPSAPRSSHNFLWPVQGQIVGGYGPGENGTHNDGINIAAPRGTPVRAAENGVVAYAGNELRGYGNLILIKHADGWMTAYAHNDKLLVKRGDVVQRGQQIARLGSTGAVTEPQLHFEIRHGARALDPAEYLPSPAATAATSG